MAQRVRPDRLADPGAAGHPADDPGGAVPVEWSAVRCQEDRPVAALADRQVDRPRRARCQRMVTTLPPLRVMVRVR